MMEIYLKILKELMMLKLAKLPAKLLQKVITILMMNFLNFAYAMIQKTGITANLLVVHQHQISMIARITMTTLRLPQSFHQQLQQHLQQQ